MAASNTERRTEPGSHEVCDGRMPALVAVDVSGRLAGLPGWDIVDGKLTHTFRCQSFNQSIGFVEQIAAIADSVNHHPDICVHDKRSVRVTTWTRKMRCLTALDFDLAEYIGRLHLTEFAERVTR